MKLMNAYKLFCVPQRERGFRATPIRDETKHCRDKNTKEQHSQMEHRYSRRLVFKKKKFTKWEVGALNAVCGKLENSNERTCLGQDHFVEGW